MLASLQIMIVYAVFVSSVYWIIPIKMARFRQYYILFASCFLIFLYNPLILLLLALITVLAYGLFKIAVANPRLSWVAWFIFLPLFLSNFLTNINLPEWLVGSPRSAASANWVFLGMSYYSIKTYISIKEALKQGYLSLSAMTLANTFFPSFVAGPIDGASRFDLEATSRNFDFMNYVLGWSRIGIGLVKVIVVLVWLKTTASGVLLERAYADADKINWGDATASIALSYSFLSFLVLYINFSGFTDMAVGIGKLFGLKISENFRAPLLSHSIQNFWQRWHLSLSHFITKYLFKPLLRQTGRPMLSIVIAFVLVGMWHNLSWGYLIWGLAHGSLLGLYARYMKGFTPSKSVIVRALTRVLGIIVTLFIVSNLSAIANLPNVSDIPQFILSYFRF